ncbi:cytidine deaminase [bacterium]|nr:cytidine deaminase [bacterium]
MSPEELIRRAVEVREHARAPYSGYRVGAAVLSADGRVFLGVNVENAVYGESLCAERNAAGSAVAAGALPLVACAIVAGPADSPPRGAWPCGACRQFLHELGGGGLKVYTLASDGSVASVVLAELLPRAFGPDSLGYPEPARPLQRMQDE